MSWYLVLVLAVYAAFIGLLGYYTVRTLVDDARESRERRDR